MATWTKSVGHTLETPLAPLPTSGQTWGRGKRRSRVRSHEIQARVSTDLLAGCSRAPRPSPSPEPFVWRRGGPRLQSSRVR